MSQWQRVHSLLSCTYNGTYVPCSPYTHLEYSALRLMTQTTINKKQQQVRQNGRRGGGGSRGSTGSHSCESAGQRLWQWQWAAVAAIVMVMAKGKMRGRGDQREGLGVCRTSLGVPHIQLGDYWAQSRAIICAYPNFWPLDRGLSAQQIDLSACTDRKMVILYVYLSICTTKTLFYRTENLRRCAKKKSLHTVLCLSAYMYIF